MGIVPTAFLTVPISLETVTGIEVTFPESGWAVFDNVAADPVDKRAKIRKRAAAFSSKIMVVSEERNFPGKKSFFYLTLRLKSIILFFKKMTFQE